MAKREKQYGVSGWLNSQGGRSLLDVNLDAIGYFVYMNARGKIVKIYIPRMFEDELNKIMK